MIVYIDEPPHVDDLNGPFMLTMKSGDTTYEFALTRHALLMLDAQCGKALAIRQIADLNEPIQFKKRKRKA